MCEKETEQVVLETSKNIFAPAINSFVLHILYEAQKNEVDTIFFLARDAFLEYILARKYVEKFGLNIQCKYLYVSRLSLRVPLYHLDIEQAVSYITLGGIDVTPVKVINRTGLPEDKRDKFADKIADYLGIAKETQIPRERLDDVKKLLIQDEKFIEELKTNSYLRYEDAINYLRESGFGTDDKIAIVDSGWVGSIQQSLETFRKQLGVFKPIDGYYYGLYELPDGAAEEYYHTFLFGPRSRLKEKVDFNNCLFEAIFSAPHGMTIEYKNEPHGTIPVLSEITDGQVDFTKQIENELINYQRELFDKYTRFADIFDAFNSRKARYDIEKNLFRFMTNPTKEEAEAFGKMHFSDDVIDYDDDVMANRLSEKEMTDNHLLRRIFLELTGRLKGQKEVVKVSAWYEGSVMLYSDKSRIRHHLLGYKQYKYFMQYCKRRRWIRKRKKYEKTGI